MVYIIVQISPKIGFNLGTVPYREALLDSIRFSDGQVYSLICKYEDDPTFDSVWCKSDVLGNANFSSRVKREVKRSKAKWFYIPNGDEVIEIDSLAAFYNPHKTPHLYGVGIKAIKKIKNA